MAVAALLLEICGCLAQWPSDADSQPGDVCGLWFLLVWCHARTTVSTRGMQMRAERVTDYLLPIHLIYPLLAAQV